MILDTASSIRANVPFRHINLLIPCTRQLGYVLEARNRSLLDGLILNELNDFGSILAAVVVVIHLHATIGTRTFMSVREKADLLQTIHAIVQLYHYPARKQDVDRNHQTVNRFAHVLQR